MGGHKVNWNFPWQEYTKPDGSPKAFLNWSGDSSVHDGSRRGPEIRAIAPSNTIFRGIGSVASLAVTGGASLLVQGVGMVIGGLFLEPVMLVANIIYRKEEEAIDPDDPNALYKKSQARDRIKGTAPGQGFRIGGAILSLLFSKK